METTRKTILIIDSDSRHSANLAGILQKKGYQVRRAWDPDEAVESALHGGVELVLTDHNAPAIDGIGLTRKLKNAGRGVHVIFFSESLDLDMYLAAMNNGAEDCLEKPCKPDELLRAVESSFRAPAGVH